MMHTVVNNRYVLHEELGRGGMGVVFRAWDRLQRSHVALKRVLAGDETARFGQRGLSESERALRLSLAREFRTVATLRHPNIVSVLDYGFDAEQQPYFTMALLEATQPVIAYAHEQDMPTRVNLLLQLLQALHYSHRRHIIHRDIKPDNVLVTADGTLKLLDFGLAQSLVQPDLLDETAGTLGYMAPEVLMGKTATVQSDLYAVGVLAYQLLLGQHPFHADSARTMIQRVLYDYPDITSLPPRLAVWVGALLSKEPDDRYADADRALNALRRATDSPAQPSPHLRESYLQASVFVGREQELAHLLTALEALKQKQPLHWLVGGESGAGKSRLFQEFRAHALVAGCLVLEGQATDAGGPLFQMWRGVIRRLLLQVTINDRDASVLKSLIPEIALLLQRPVADPPPLSGDEFAQRLILAMTDLFQRATQPIVLLLEDLHWAQEDLSPLQALLERAAELPNLMIVGSYRSDEALNLAALLPQMGTIVLPPLNRSDIAQLSSAMLGPTGRSDFVVDLLQRETEGNPFFMVEVVRALSDATTLDPATLPELPSNVLTGGMQALLQRRLQKIASDYTPVTQLAAIVGREVDTHLLQAAFPNFSIDDWLYEAEAAAVLSVQAHGWRFAHDKLRETVLSAINPAQTAILHQRAAEAIESTYSDQLDDYAEPLFRHWRAAGVDQKTLVYMVQVIDRLIVSGGAERAQHQLMEGLEIIPNLPAHQQGHHQLALTQRLGEVALELSDYEAALEHYQQALTLAASQEEHNIEVDCLNGLSDVYERLGHYDEARDYAQQAHDKAQAIDYAAGLALSLFNSGAVAYAVGQSDAAAADLARGSALYEKIGDQRGAARCLNILGLLAYNAMAFTEAQTHHEASLALSREIGDQRGIGRSLTNLGLLAYLQQDYTAANEYYEQALVIFQRIGNRMGYGMLLGNLGEAAREEGRLHQAELYHAESLQIARDVGDPFWIATSLNDLSLVAIDGNRLPQAAETLLEAMQVSSEVGIQDTLLRSICWAGVAAYRNGDTALTLRCAAYIQAHELGELMFVNMRDALDRFDAPEHLGAAPPVADMPTLLAELRTYLAALANRLSGTSVTASVEQRQSDEAHD